MKSIYKQPVLEVSYVSEDIVTASVAGRQDGDNDLAWIVGDEE